LATKKPDELIRSSTSTMQLLRQIRVLLRTFAIGLSAVWLLNGLDIARRDMPVDLPSASEDVLYVYPDTSLPFIRDESAAGGGRGSLQDIRSSHERIGNGDYGIRCDRVTAADRSQLKKIHSPCG
jgi:hypothetical protein